MKVQLWHHKGRKRLTELVVFTLLAHCLHCFSSRQSPAALARSTSSGLSLRSSHFRLCRVNRSFFSTGVTRSQTRVSNPNDLHYQVRVVPTLSWEKLGGRTLSLLLYRSRCWRLLRFPRSSGREVSWFLLRSTFTRWVRLQNSGCIGETKSHLKLSIKLVHGLQKFKMNP